MKQRFSQCVFCEVSNFVQKLEVLYEGGAGLDVAAEVFKFVRKQVEPAEERYEKE